MKQLIITLALGLAACGQGGGAPSGGSPSLVIPPTGNGVATLYIFGDDVSYGTGSTSSYVSQLTTRSSLPTVNLSYANANLGGAVTTMNNTIQTYGGNGGAWTNAHLDTNLGPEDTVIIFAGSTDARWYGNAVPGNYLQNNLVQLLTKIKTSGAKLYVVGTIAMPLATYAMFAPLNNGSDAAMTTWNNAIAAQVTALNYSRATFINALTQFNAIGANYNGQYPSDAGHTALATIIANGMGI